MSDLLGIVSPKSRDKTAGLLGISRIFAAELCGHAFFLIRNGEMPNQVKYNNPNEVNPMVEINGKTGSSDRDKRCVERMPHPSIGSLSA